MDILFSFIVENILILSNSDIWIASNSFVSRCLLLRWFWIKYICFSLRFFIAEYISCRSKLVLHLESFRCTLSNTFRFIYNVFATRNMSFSCLISKLTSTMWARYKMICIRFWRGRKWTNITTFILYFFHLFIVFHALNKLFVLFSSRLLLSLVYQF